jgi:hypothetical protein
MKHISLPLSFVCLCFLLIKNAAAQPGSIGIGTTTPNASAALEVKSTTKGILIPRTSTAGRTAIVSPAKGLMVYDTTSGSFWYYNSSAWIQIGAGSTGWSLTGNSGTNPATNFIGTTNAQPLRFRVNNAWAGEIHPTTGNVFFGAGAGKTNTTGEGNTGIGDHSLFANTEGGFNTAVGNYALPANTTGSNNSAVGVYALSNNTTGGSNTAIGRNALFANTTGQRNTATGEGALLTNTAGEANTANGYQALYSNNGNGNTANGFQALYLNTSGLNNTANGIQALNENTTGNSNTANGAISLVYNTTGSDNTATGANAMQDNTIGSDNTATGKAGLLQNTTGNANTATGKDALRSNTTGSNNTAIGVEALTANTSGVFNTAVGYYALHANATGWYNTAVGDGALFSNTGDQNIAIGYSSGTHPNTPNVYNTISIGNDGLLNAYQNQAFIGNNSTLFIGGKVNWGVISDARVKNNINEDVKGLDFILKLRPVTYHISNQAITTLTGNKATPDFPGKYDSEKIKYTGFLAQEVEKAAKAVNYEFSGYDTPKNEWGFYSIKYAEFVVPLVKAVQEQQQQIELLKQQNELLLKEMQIIKAKLK